MRITRYCQPFLLGSVILLSLTGAVAQEISKEESDLYASFYGARAEVAKAMPLARAYVQKFPQGKYSEYLGKWISANRANLFNDAVVARNSVEMIRLGKEILAEQPDNLDYLYSLAMQLRFIELPNRSATPAHLSELTEYTQRTINLIEAGKVPTTIDKEKWRRNQTLSWFYQTLAMLEKADDKALELYAKSSSLDPMNAHNFLICGSIHQQRYLPAAEKFGSFQAADRDNVVTENAKPEVKAVYDEVNREADAIIDCWARFMGLTVNDTSFGETRTKISEALTDLYKYRHPDSPDGLQKLIEQYKKR